MNWRDHIDRNPEVMGGKPKVRGTRIGVALILERLGDGWSVEQLIEAYPNITVEQIRACQAFAKETLVAHASGDGHDRTDPLIKEIHEYRRAIGSRFGGDARRISEEAQRRQHEENRPVWGQEHAGGAAEQPNGIDDQGDESSGP